MKLACRCSWLLLTRILSPGMADCVGKAGFPTHQRTREVTCARREEKPGVQRHTCVPGLLTLHGALRKRCLWCNETPAVKYFTVSPRSWHHTRSSSSNEKLPGSKEDLWCPNLKCPGGIKRNGSNPTCVDRPLRTSEATSVMSHHHRSPGEEWELWPSRGCLSDRTEPPSKFKLMSRKEGYLANPPACVSGYTGSTRGCSVMSYKASRSQDGPGLSRQGTGLASEMFHWSKCFTRNIC